MLYSLPKYLQAKYNNSSVETHESFENTYKQDLLQWVKKQSINEVAVNSKKVTAFIIRMYLHDLLVERSNYALKEENPRFPLLCEDITNVCLVRKRRSHDEEKLHLEEKLLSKIYIVDQDDIFDKFCLQGSLEEIVNLLIECSNGLAFTSQPKVTFNCKQYIVNDAIWFNPKTYQTCVGWIINEFEKAIALIYYQQESAFKNENNFLQLNDIKSFWINDQDNFRNKIINQINQISKEFKNAHKKKTTKQEDIQWAQQILKNEKTNDDKSSLIIKEDEILRKVNENQLDEIYYLPIKRINSLQALCEKRILRIIIDSFKEKLMKDLQEIEGKEKDKKKINEQIKKKTKKHKKNKKDNTNTIQQKNENIDTNKINNSENIENKELIQEKTQEIIQNQQQLINNLQNNNNNEELVTIPEEIHINNIEEQEQNLSQNTDDDESWVVITAPKKQKKINQRKFFSQKDLHQKQYKICKQIKNEHLEQQVSCEQINDKNKSDTTQSHSPKERNNQNEQNNFTPEKIQIKQPISEKKLQTELNIPIINKENEFCGQSTTTNKQLIQQLSLLQEIDDFPMLTQDSIKEQQITQYEIDQQVMIQARNYMIKKLDMDMREFSDIMTTQNQQLLHFRRVIYDRLQFIVNFLFRDLNASIRLFGSCATGLSLPESDLDIGILGFEVFPTAQLNSPMQKITDFLSQMKWILNIRTISTSTMPLIKLQVDPKISFQDSNHQIGLPYININLDPDNPYINQIFSVDLSFVQFQGPKTIQHWGQISTDCTLQWISFYQELRPLVLLFKSLLKKRGLNDQYKGGLSSFCIIQMVLAFLEYNYQQEQATSIGFTTYKFLKFFGTEFDPQKTGISYKGLNENPFFELSEDDDQLQITIVSPLTNEIISQASSFVQTILSDLKTLYLATENEVTFFYEKLKYNKKKKGKKEERNLFQKELNKLLPLFSNTVYNKP